MPSHSVLSKRSLAHRKLLDHADRIEQPSASALRVLDAIRTIGQIINRAIQPPNAENRTFGGVGGLADEILSARPDHPNPEILSLPLSVL